MGVKYFVDITLMLLSRLIPSFIVLIVWAHKTSLNPPLLLKCLGKPRTVSVMYICVLGVLNLSLSTIFPLDFGTVPTYWYLFF